MAETEKRIRSQKKAQSKKGIIRPTTEKAHVEVSAGGIVYKRTSRGVRVAFILDPFSKWAFAKGHVEEGETIEEAAVRETMEEMGLDTLRIVRKLGIIDFWFRDRYRPETRGALVHKYVHYYLMEAPADAMGTPQKKEKIRRVIWVGIGNMMRRSSYDDVKPILEKAARHFGLNLRQDRVPRKPQQKNGTAEQREKRNHHKKRHPAWRRRANIQSKDRQKQNEKQRTTPTGT